MYILTLKGKPDGVYCIKMDHGEQVIPIFEEEDDAIRYYYMIEDTGEYPELQVLEIEEETIVHACEDREQKYAIIGIDDFIVPPNDIE